MGKDRRAGDGSHAAAWMAKVDKLLVRSIAVFVALLLLSQLLLQYPSVRHRLTTTGPAEGIPYAYSPHRH